MIAGIVKELNRTYGAGTVVRASNVRFAISKFSTGSASLDIGLGGGWAYGRLHEIIGAFSSAKTSLAILSAREFLRENPDGIVIYVDTERGFDPAWSKRLGLDNERMIVVNPKSGEEAADVALEALKGEGPRFLILDSISALIPTKEIEEDMEKSLPGAHARLVTKFCRKLLPVLRRDLESEKPNVTGLFLNQVRLRIGVFYGNPETGTGGRGREFFISTQTILRRTEFLKIDKKTVGMEIAFRVTKNKTGGGMDNNGFFHFYFSHPRITGLDNGRDLLPLAVLHRIVAQKGRTFSYEGHKWVGEKEASRAIRTDTGLQRLIKHAILAQQVEESGEGHRKTRRRALAARLGTDRTREGGRED